MKPPSVVAVDREAEAFASLFVAAREMGVRIGWLDLAGESAAPIPEDLARAAALGAMRAVQVRADRVVTVKPIAGPAVLRDLVREHFLGCGLVLARGLDGWPKLEPAATGFELRSAADRRRSFAAAELLAELLRPRHRMSAGTR